MCSAETLCWKHSLLCPVAKCFSFHHQLPSVSKRCKDNGAERIKGRPCVTISFWSVSLSDQLIMSLAMLSREDFSQYLSHTFSLWSIFPPVCRLFVCCGRSWRSMEPLLCFFYLVKDRKTEQTMSEKGRFSPLAQTFKIKDGIKSKGWVSSFLDSLLWSELWCWRRGGSLQFFLLQLQTVGLQNSHCPPTPPPPPAESHTWGTLQSW